MKIHHLALRTRDLPRLLAFYGDLLGLPRAARPGPASAASAWLAAGEALIMLELADESEPAVTAGSRELVAFGIEPGDRAAFEAKLADHGVPVEACTTFTLYFRDPDGRRVAVSHYPESPSRGGTLPR